MSSAPFPSTQAQDSLDLITACKEKSKPELSPGQITQVGVITNDRPEILERGLSSYVLNNQRYGRKCEYTVMDDSKGRETQEKNRAALLALSKKLNVKISYASSSDKDRYVDLLVAESKLPREVVEFAISNKEYPGQISPGANRNALLLHAVGEVFFCADDDTICDLFRRRLQSSSDLVVTGVIDPTLVLPRDGSDPGEDILPSEADFLAEHELLLGKDFGACFSDSVFGKIDIALSGENRATVDSLPRRRVGLRAQDWTVA